MYFIEEDDGSWWINEEPDEEYGRCAYQDSFSIGWAESFTNAIKNLKEYVYTNGTPVYFSGLTEKIICHYTL